MTPSAGSSPWHLQRSTSQPHVLHGPWLCSLSWQPASCLLHDRCSCFLETAFQDIRIPCHWILMPEHNSCERQFCMWRRLGNPRALDVVLPCAQISKKLPRRKFRPVALSDRALSAAQRDLHRPLGSRTHVKRQLADAREGPKRIWQKPHR